MTITQRMYRALLGAQTTQQSAQAAAPEYIEMSGRRLDHEAERETP